MKNFILSAALISTALADPRQPEFYLREEIPMPEGEVLELGGIAIMPDKKVAVSSRRGDIWVCEGAYGKISQRSDGLSTREASMSLSECSTGTGHFLSPSDPKLQNSRILTVTVELIISKL